MTQEYYKPLDAIRGFLALAVVFYHARWGGFLSTNAFAENGYLAVDVFFCLSGFLMFILYRSMSSREDVKSFMIKRFARLYPLHLFTLFGMLLYTLARLIAYKSGLPVLGPDEAVPFTSGAHETFGSLLSNLTLTQGLGVHDKLSFNGPSWSISTEFYTYIVFATGVVALPIKKAWHLAVIIAATAVIYFGLSLLRPNLDVTYDLGFLRCLAGFGAGITAAAVFKSTRSFFAARSKSSATLIELSIVVIFIAWFCTAKGAATFFAAPIMILLILTFANDRGWASDFMNLPIFQYLGKVSYSVYLNHSLVLVCLDMVISRLPGGREALSSFAGDMLSVVYLALVLISSHITYHLIEKPSGKFIRARLLKRKAVAA